MKEDQDSRRVINHKRMRVVVGIIAVLLSPVVWVLAGESPELTSVSISYWTDSRDVFVGSLIAVGFFLSAYNGAGDGKDWEYYLSRAGWILATCVAIFPTAGFDELDVPAAWVMAVSQLLCLTPEKIHYTAAILLFACLFALIWFFSNRAKQKGKPGRAAFYRATGIAMILGIAVLMLAGWVFWAEAWGLTLFGIGWFVAGTYKHEDPASQQSQTAEQV